MRRITANPRVALLILPVSTILLFFVTPLVFLAFVSFMKNSTSSLFEFQPTFANYIDAWTDPFVLMVIQRTIITVMIVSGLCVSLGYPTAVILASLPPAWRLVGLLLLTFPLMVGNVIRAYGWIAILSRRGLLNTLMVAAGLLDRPSSMLYKPDAITVGLLTILMPYMIISLTNSLVAIDHRYYEAAESLGANGFHRFFRVTLPLSTPGLASGLMLVSFLTLSAYVTIALLGGPRYKLLVSLAFDAASTFRWPMAAALAFTLLIIALSAAAIIQLMLRPQRVQGRG